MLKRWQKSWRSLCLTTVLMLLAFAAATPARAQETYGYTTPNLPPNYNKGTEYIDSMYDFILYLTGGVMIAVFICLVLFLVRYRHRPGRRATYIHGNQKLEIVWTLIPSAILVLIAAFSQNIWSQMKSPALMPTGDDVVRVRVVARQFNWFFQYPGPDGKFGETDVHWRQDSGDAAAQIGLRRGNPEYFMSEAQLQALRDDSQQASLLEPDPNAYDDICTTTSMYVPVNKKVHVELTSKDVLHSFFLPNFRVKQDAVPGLTGHVWIHSTVTSAEVVGRDANGEAKPFDIVCAELCGANHYTMQGLLFVVSDQEYQQWLEDNATDPSEFEE